MKKLVLTGAAGRLGSYLREPLSKMADELVSTDIADAPAKLYPGERYQRADLANADEIDAVIAGADMVVHFGAIGDEAPFGDILQANIIGGYNVWEAAHRHGVRRIVYASSIHAVGMFEKTRNIGVDAAHRPDTYYGLSKCFCEDLARMYWDKRGIEAVCLRILSCAQVTSARALGTWLSYDDLIQLVSRAIDTPVTGFCIAYGVSANDRAPVNNVGVEFLGYRPQSNAEAYAAEMLATTDETDLSDLAHTRHGGAFASVPLGESGQAGMTIIDDRKTD